MEFENTATDVVEVETGQEVAEPAETEETGSNEQEVAEPASEQVPTRQDSETNAAFQRMRHAEQEAARARAELEELKAQYEARNNVITRITGAEDGGIAALAEASGLSEDDIRAEMEAAQESVQKDLTIQNLERRLQAIEVDNMMAADLAEIQKIDPSIKSLHDLGPGYYDYTRAGLDPVRAYWALKAEERANHREPPKPVGKVATGTSEPELTQAMIDAMSPEQLAKNHNKIIAFWEKQSKR